MSEDLLPGLTGIETAAAALAEAGAAWGRAPSVIALVRSLASLRRSEPSLRDARLGELLMTTTGMPDLSLEDDAHRGAGPGCPALVL